MAEEGTYFSGTPCAPVSVIVATFGDPDWVSLAHRRAIPSVFNQQLPPAELKHIHGVTLAVARNRGAALVKADWLCFLDADDELEPGFLQECARAIDENPEANLINPAVRWVNNGVPSPEAILIDARPPAVGNYLIIGTLIRRSLFNTVGGFRERDAWEDWELFYRCHLQGAHIVRVPTAVYRAHQHPGSRNLVDGPTAARLTREIRRAVSRDYRPARRRA